MTDQIFGEKFTFSSFNEAQSVIDNADMLIDKNGYITVEELLKLIFHGMTGVWPGREKMLKTYGWQDTLGWKVKQGYYIWILDTPEPQPLQELGGNND